MLSLVFQTETAGWTSSTAERSENRVPWLDKVFLVSSRQPAPEKLAATSLKFRDLVVQSMCTLIHS
jgi:hypothetical protein